MLSSRSMDTSSSDSPDGTSNCEGPPPQPRKPIPRKGHTKSRRGCFNCKRRRIKCNERHPECNHCIKAGLQCEYPANIIQSGHRSPTSPCPQEMVNLRSTPGAFVSALQFRQMLAVVNSRHADHVRHALVPSLFNHSLSSSASGRRQDMDNRDSCLCTQCMFKSMVVALQTDIPSTNTSSIPFSHWQRPISTLYRMRVSPRKL
jgi:hypothetical protein